MALGQHFPVGSAALQISNAQFQVNRGASRFCKNILVYRDIREFESILSPAPLLPCSPAPLLVGYICTIGMLP